MHLMYSVHHCTECDKFFNADMSDLALPGATTRTASSPWPSVWWSKTACLTRPPVGTYGGIIGSLCPLPPSRTGLRPGEKKAEARINADYLDWALAEFSGYIAADELYDGPYCVLSIVDNRTFKRIFYRVLDHDPTHDDIREFFTAFRDALHVRGLLLRGITTDGSPLYPGPIAAIFPGVRHQVCEFHVRGRNHQSGAPRGEQGAEATRRPEDSAGPWPSSRQGGQASGPTKRAAAGGRSAICSSIGIYLLPMVLLPRNVGLFNGSPVACLQLRTLREIMDEVYRLFDRRCRTDTALTKLAKLRMRVRRFRKVGKTLSKLFSPNLEKALTFLDDSLLPATSNAVERGKILRSTPSR